MSVLNIPIGSIQVSERVRKDNGDIIELAKSIREHGLINPITVMKRNGKYILIAGFRRLYAMKLLHWQEVPAAVLSPVNAEEQLKLEIEENETRKNFTNSERVWYARKLMVMEAEKARRRHATHTADGYIRITEKKGRTRDIVAQKVGYKSGRQLDRALYVESHRPDLMVKIDNGSMSISHAYQVAKEMDHTTGPERVSDSASYQPSYETVLDEIETATASFLRAVEKASEHYLHVKQTDARSEAIFSSLKSVSQDAMTIFSDRLYS